MRHPTDATQPHQWGKPPPAQGSARDAVCRVCGARRSVAGTESPCPGRSTDAAIETVWDYEPFED